MASQPAVINAIDFLYNAFTTSGPNAAGAGTITLKAPLPPTAAGLPIIINTSAPITVGGDSNSETVTPTAVAYDQFGNVNITANFANAHGVGEPVTTASFGMQEAASYALSKGGGLVALSHQWFAATGLSHANAITFLETFLSLSANIAILDYSGVSGSAYSYTAAAGSNYAATAYHLY